MLNNSFLNQSPPTCVNMWTRSTFIEGWVDFPLQVAMQFWMLPVSKINNVGAKVTSSKYSQQTPFQNETKK